MLISPSHPFPSTSYVATSRSPNGEICGAPGQDTTRPVAVLLPDTQWDAEHAQEKLFTNSTRMPLVAEWLFTHPNLSPNSHSSRPEASGIV